MRTVAAADPNPNSAPDGTFSGDPGLKDEAAFGEKLFGKQENAAGLMSQNQGKADQIQERSVRSSTGLSEKPCALLDSRTYLEARRRLSVPVWQRSSIPEEAKDLVHHVGMVDGLLLVPLHLLQQLLLPAGLLPLLSLSLLLLLGKLVQTLLVLPAGLGLGPLRRHLVQEALFLQQTLLLCFLPLVELWGQKEVRPGPLSVRTNGNTGAFLSHKHLKSTFMEDDSGHVWVGRRLHEFFLLF